MGQVDRAVTFRGMHRMRPLVLPNAWDAMSARIIERAGAPAIATTSAGVSWTFGRRDGQRLQREEMLHAIRRIVCAVSVPVSADVESGYGDGSPADIADTVRALLDLGVAGINLEDSPGGAGEPLMSAEQHAERIRAARSAANAAGGDLVINARTDVYLAQVGAAETRFDAAVHRANVYRRAGADCVFVPGVIDAETIGALARAIDGPLNIMAMPGAPTVGRLGELGVARVSVGPVLALRALAATHLAAREMLGGGGYGAGDALLPFGEVNTLFP